MKLKPETARQIRSTKRTFRKAKRGLTGAAYERRRLALKSLTELQDNPLRPGLGLAVAMNVADAA